MIFTGNVSINQMTGPVGISQIVSTTSGIVNYIYIMAVISISLGITNLLPIPALDGGKIVLLLIEAIRRKPLKMETEAIIQLVGFALIMFVAIFVTYNDIARIF
jgi:regulator of sigma E protease